MTHLSPAICDALARMLEYPTESFAAEADRFGALLDDAVPVMRESFAAFEAGIRPVGLEAMEELYIRTFDFNPKATLDLGWQLFAEDYNRGLFLAKLRSESRRMGVIETRELPDHLPHVLRLLGRMDPEAAADFTATCVAPAVEKTIEGVDEANPYRHLLRCVSTMLAAVAGSREEVSPR